MPLVTYLYKCTFSLILPCLTILPRLCSRSAGRHGTSKSCRAMILSCTFVPVPILPVEPSKILTSPLLTFENNSDFWASVFALCIYAISVAGMPFAMSLSLMSSYTQNLPVSSRESSSATLLLSFCSFEESLPVFFDGTPRSQKTIWVSLSFAVSV